MKNQGKINLTIDLLLFLVLSLVTGIGFLIKYTLPPGRERVLNSGENTELVFLGLDRHQWGTIHLTLACVMLGLLALHLIVHRKIIGNLLRSLVPSLILRRLLATGFTLLSAFLLFFFILIPPQRDGHDDFLYRNSRANTFLNPRIGAESPTQGKTKEMIDDRTEVGALHERGEEGNKAKKFSYEHEENKGEALLHGRTTIAGAARLYGISTLTVKKKIGIPMSTSDRETMGRLGRVHGFTMEQARKRLEQNRGLHKAIL